MRSGPHLAAALAVALAAVIAAAPTAAAPCGRDGVAWRVTMIVTERGSADPTPLTFGVDPAATDTTDWALGEVLLPPPPPSGIRDVRFTNQGGLHVDLRPNTPDSTWVLPLTFQRTQGNPIVVSWSRQAVGDAIGPGAAPPRLQDAGGGALGIDVDMTAADSVVVDNVLLTGLLVRVPVGRGVPNPDALRFVSLPPRVVRGTAFETAVEALCGGAPEPGVAVELALSAGGGTLTGSLSATAGRTGRAPFSGLRYAPSVDGERLRLRATARNATGTTVAQTSAEIAADVVATRLAFTGRPSAAISGQIWSPQPAVEARDDAGLTDIDFSELVTLTASGPGSLQGPATVRAVAGMARWTDLGFTATVDGASVALSAAGGGLGSGVVGTVAVDVVATRLVFATQPAGAVDGNRLAVQPVVAARDATGVTDGDFAEVITMTGSAVEEQGPAGEGLTGTTTARAVDGVARFTDLVWDVGTTGDTARLTADDEPGVGSDLPAAISAPFSGEAVLDSAAAERERLRRLRRFY